MDYVKYIGVSTIREITREQWEGAGVKDQPGLVWDAGNGYNVSVSAINKQALDVLRADGYFLIPETKTEDKPSPARRD